MATFKVTMTLRDKWAGVNDGDGPLDLTLEQVREQLQGGRFDFGGVEVLELSVKEEVRIDRQKIGGMERGAPRE